MEKKPVDIKETILVRNVMIKKEEELYLQATENFNARLAELTKEEDFNSILVENFVKDSAGEIVRRYFDFGDCYVTADQLCDRFLNFSYDNDIDPLASNENIKKEILNYTDSDKSATITEIKETCERSKKILCEESRPKDKRDQEGKKAYRESQTAPNGNIFDELTGALGEKKTIEQNGKNVEKSCLQADHVQSRAAATYNSRYINSEDAINKLKDFINSEDNMEMMRDSANSSKGDVRICEIGGKRNPIDSKELNNRIASGEKIKDVTYNATPEELTDAVVKQWEKATKSGHKMEILKEKGYLDEKGKVKPDVRKKVLAKIEKSQNAESKIILKNTNYKVVGKDALRETKKSFGKILAGQVLYYFVPPVIFESKTILKKSDTLTMEGFYYEFEHSTKRIVAYVVSKIEKILKNVATNGIKKFVKTFFDIIIEMLKASVKRMAKIVKDIALSLISCGRVIMDSKTTSAEKADSITKILATTITTIVINLIFEYLAKQFMLPGFLVEVLQVIVTILSTNVVMLLLQELDLFDVKYGLLVSNIEKAFNEENEKYLSQSETISNQHMADTNKDLETIKTQIADLTKSINSLDLYTEEVTPYLDEISKTFNMDIDFSEEWNEYLGISVESRCISKINNNSEEGELLEELTKVYYNNYFFRGKLLAE